MKRDVKESAQEVRKVLRAEWPDTKFSVRSERFSGNSAVRITWTDGPTEHQVSQATAHLKGWDNGFYNDYVSTSRHTSRIVMDAATRAAAAFYGVPEPALLGDDNPYVSDYTTVGFRRREALCDKIHRATWQTDVYGVAEGDLIGAFTKTYREAENV
jgi:hypothetical protein